MATCSLDEYVKVWDIAAAGGQPKLISYKKLGMGELFSLSFYKDIPWVLAAGGSKGEVAVWDIEESETIAKHFTPFLDKSTLAASGFEEESEEEEDGEEEDSDEDKKKPVTKKKQAKVKKAT
jgi:periodic tryptophan protein 1